MSVRYFTRVKTRWFYALAPHKACEGLFSLVFPLFLYNVLQLAPGMVGLLSGCISLTAVPGAMFWGYVSDRYHIRRALLVLGCLMGGVCLGAMGLTSTSLPMLLLCLVYGFFSIAPAPIASVLIMETLPRAQWDQAFGRFSKIGGWGWIGGLVLGAWMLPLLVQWFSREASLRVTLLGLAAMTLYAAWWAARTIPEPMRRMQRRQFVDVTHHLPALTMIERVLYLPRRVLFVMRYAHLWQLYQLVPQALWRYFAATAIMFVSFTMALMPFPLFLQEVFHMDTSHIFLLLLVRALATIPCYEWVGYLEERMGPQRLQIYALIGRCVGFGSLTSLGWLTAPSLHWSILIGASILIGMTWSILAVSGPILVGKLAVPGRQGEAMGLYNAIQGVAQILGAMLGGYLAQWMGYGGVFAVAGVLLVAAIGLLATLRLQETPDFSAAAGPSQAPYGA